MIESDRLTASEKDVSIIEFVELVLAQAIEDNASDIHFEPFEDALRIRSRVDGALYEMAPAPRRLSTPVVSRIKVLANLNIAERRIPQDGRFTFTSSGKSVDLRISTLPIRHGESVVLRVLDRSAAMLDLERLGMSRDLLAGVRKAVSKPDGVFVVTGPTGSGKTTTLYCALLEVNRPEVKILTAEDPVEYELDGIMQVPISPRIGLTFPEALRSFLRQDPDKILVGEIRDFETAQIAVQAALTGHLVMTTLHTNDAPGAVTRLIDIGVEPFLVGAVLEAALGQRLVRRICPSCRSQIHPSAELVDRLNIPEGEVNGVRFYSGKGCRNCKGIGYLGRFGLFELMAADEEMQELISRRPSATSLRKCAKEKGMMSLREEGVRAILEGETDIEEVLRYT